MVSISGVIFILASLDGRLDLSDNSDLPCSFSQFIQRYNVERVIPHRRAVFVTEPVSTYSSSHFWRIRISSFMLRRYRLRFAYEKKKCSVSIDTLQIRRESAGYVACRLFPPLTAKTLLGQSSNEVMAVVTEIPWEQVVRFAHLLQSCYRSDASTPV